MSAPTAPNTAVVIAAYNAAATLERAVVSALAQPECAELCIVDDASCDATAALARDWAQRDGRVGFISQAVNAGPGAARNVAISVTRAPWIAILDADDYMLPGRLAALLAHREKADFVADALMRSPDGAPPPRAPSAAFDPQILSFEAFVLGNLGALKGPLDLGFLKPVFRRDFLVTHNLRYQPDLRLGEDYEFYARALAVGARFLVGGPAGYVSVEREGSLSAQHSETDLQRLRDCDAGLASAAAYSRAERLALKRHWSSVDCRLQWRRLISAVKRRDPGAALSTFHTLDAAFFLATRLGEQMWLRGGRLARRLTRRPGAQH